jgi:hypothetical protein
MGWRELQKSGNDLSWGEGGEKTEGDEDDTEEG